MNRVQRWFHRLPPIMSSIFFGVVGTAMLTPLWLLLQPGRVDLVVLGFVVLAIAATIAIQYGRFRWPDASDEAVQRALARREARGGGSGQ